MATTLQIVNIIVSCVTVITGCLMICWLLTFHYLTHISAISQRRPNTTLFIGILQIVGSLLAHNVQLIFLNTESIPYVPYINLLFFIMVCCTASGSYHLLTYRAFMVYYDIKWNKAIQDSKWRMYIDPNETNWFLKFSETTALQPLLRRVNNRILSTLHDASIMVSKCPEVTDEHTQLHFEMRV
eukprot:653403_1